MAACGVEFSLKAAGNIRTGWPTRMWRAHCGPERPAYISGLQVRVGKSCLRPGRHRVAGLLRPKPPYLHYALCKKQLFKL